MILGTIEATCQECRDTFPPQEGGICGRCGRLLCRWHLHGLGGRLRQVIRRGSDQAQVVCVRCARGRSRDHAGG